MNRTSILLTGTLLAVITSLSSCEELMVAKPTGSSPETNFRLMWDKYDTHYGLFAVKNIDWNSVYTAHLPMAQAARTDKELFSVLSSMLRTLNDKHVNIYTTSAELTDYNSGTNGHQPAQEDFLFDVVRDNYLDDYQEITPHFGYGKLSPDLGYIHISAFKDDLSVFKEGMDKAINSLASTKGIVFDIRDHSGGSDHVSKYIAGRFAESKKLFMTSKKRNGPGHNNFDDLQTWYVEKEGKSQYTKPVILLTTPHTISAGETFTLAMRENDKVIQIGNTTAGAFSDTVPFELPNGWIYTVSVGDYRGSDGKSYEGLGIAPDIYSINKKSDLLQGIDKTLERAINLLK